MNYTLQFVQPESRLSTIKNIYNGLVPGGARVLIEKVKSEVPELNKTFPMASTEQTNPPL